MRLTRGYLSEPSQLHDGLERTRIGDSENRIDNRRVCIRTVSNNRPVAVKTGIIPKIILTPGEGRRGLGGGPKGERREEEREREREREREKEHLGSRAFVAL
jgi:hypothetical protein